MQLCCVPCGGIILLLVHAMKQYRLPNSIDLGGGGGGGRAPASHANGLCFYTHLSQQERTVRFVCHNAPPASSLSRVECYNAGSRCLEWYMWLVSYIVLAVMTAEADVP